ncbi:S1/P1 Nuclease [Catalinimonas alkaloidigena]|uniref:S1/P1 Nuclease n=1 Tax=Catalinimonas alkaloidigena TaxID=1075417 RepID=A0A1G9HD21_9BACT|nr:S1/P1 nuclease [Catalinimonas alkaloidigena]SDL10614.1 S1/P1 Nuclease [Catalinimonas alkaloidigena]
MYALKLLLALLVRNGWMCCLWLGLVVAPVHAWTRAGHMVSGALAYRYLAQGHPDVIPQVLALLKAHPQYAAWEEESRQLADPSAEVQQQFIFMAAAKWADETRNTPHYHPTWHYVNPPLSATRQTPVPIAEAQPPENILYAYQRNLGIFRADTTAEARAIALAWLFHLVGDLHQPLHTAAFFSDQFPEGDRGGNLFFIRPTEADTTINLHYFWDGLVLQSEQPHDVAQAARRLYQRGKWLPPVALDTLDATIYPESYDLALWAYRHGTLPAGVDRDHGAVLPPDYPNLARKLAAGRMVLAGWRLAEVLRQLV